MFAGIAKPRNPPDPRITVTKMEAARRQLGTAIELWFCDGDAISIHTLAAAAHQIIHDLNRKAKGPDLLFDSVIIKDEKRKQFVGLIKFASNFFKHADRGRTGTAKSIEFNPRTNETLLLVSVIALGRMKEQLTQSEKAFVSWDALHNTRNLTAEGQNLFANHFPPEKVTELRGIQKREFLRQFLERTGPTQH